MFRLLMTLSLAATLWRCSSLESKPADTGVKEKILLLSAASDTTRMCGVSLVGPAQPLDGSWTNPVREINAGWVAVQPYGYCFNGKPEVHYNSQRQWWGETVHGSTEMIRQAHRSGLKVMLKPMIWIPGGWPGGFELTTEAEWKIWEDGYRKFILEFAAIAKTENVELMVIGTEFKPAVLRRPVFWKNLIAEVRKAYPGKITFAANWDAYKEFDFWGQLDYIGVNAYFPLTEAGVPDVNELKKAWKAPLAEMAEISKKYNKKIIITELGYRSLEKTAWRQWEIQDVPENQGAKPVAQANAWKAFFEEPWKQSFIAGCFIWNWYPNHDGAGGFTDSDYTPQHKPAEWLIRDYFGKR